MLARAHARRFDGSEVDQGLVLHFILNFLNEVCLELSSEKLSMLIQHLLYEKCYYSSVNFGFG